MVGRLIAAVNEGILAVKHAHGRILLLQGRQVGVVLPQRRAGRAYVGDKSARMALVQIANRRGEHYDVTGRAKMSEDELLFHTGPAPSGLAGGRWRTAHRVRNAAQGSAAPGSGK